MNKSYIAEVLNDIAPLSTQENWDNSGFQIDTGRKDINRILVALDANLDVVEEAISKRADLIVTHHPLMFHPVKNISEQNVKGKSIISLIKAGISVYSSHTPFDKACGGNNEYILDALGCTDMCGLYDPQRDGEEPAIGRIAQLPYPLTLKAFVEKLNDVLGEPGGIKISGDPAAVIKTVAICTGAAGELYSQAINAGADCYISGEIAHHEALDARDQGLCVIDAGHYGTEWLFVPNMADKLRERIGASVEILETDVSMDPYDFII